MKHIGRDVVIKDNAITPKICSTLIELFHHDEKLIHSLGDEYVGNTQYQAVTLVSESAPRMRHFIFELLASIINEYRTLLNLPFSLGSKFEQPELMCFKHTHQHQFDVHFDGNGKDHSRTLALIFYLNTVEHGGELHLPAKNDADYLKVSPKQGRLVIVPTDWTHYHYVSAPVGTDRYSLITFIRY